MTSPHDDTEQPDEDLEAVGSIPVGTPVDPLAELRTQRAEPDVYVAVLVVETTSDAAEHQPLYEESFVLLKAADEEEAREKARSFGKELETSYEDEHHQPITWKLKDVVDVRPVEDATFDDGTELYSRFFRDYQAYRSIGAELDEEL